MRLLGRVILGAAVVIVGGSGILGGFFSSAGQDMYKSFINSQRKKKSIPAEMKKFAGGIFIMGSEKGGSDEIPHKVKLSPFLMDASEVTQERYSSLMKRYYKERFDSPHWSEEHGVGGDLPAYYVNWYEAALFCNARTKEYGNAGDTVYTFSSIEGRVNKDCRLMNCKSHTERNGFIVNDLNKVT